MNIHSLDDDMWGLQDDGGGPSLDPPQNPSMMMGQRPPPQQQRPPPQQQRPPPQQQRPPPQHQRPPPQHTFPPPPTPMNYPAPPSSHPERRPRKVHFANERQRFSRVDDGVSVESSSWLSKNSVMVMTLSVAVVLILIVALVIISKRKSATPVPNQVPAFVGGGNPWEQSVSQAHQYY